MGNNPTTGKTTDNVAQTTETANSKATDKTLSPTLPEFGPVAWKQQDRFRCNEAKKGGNLRFYLAMLNGQVSIPRVPGLFVPVTIWAGMDNPSPVENEQTKAVEWRGKAGVSAGLPKDFIGLTDDVREAIIAHAENELASYASLEFVKTKAVETLRMGPVKAKARKAASITMTV